MLSESKKSLILSRITHWLESVVIGLPLCPFASKVYRAKQIDFVLVESTETHDCLEQVFLAAQKLVEGDLQRTALVVLTDAFSNFDDYLDFFALCEALLVDTGFEGELQVASFHPGYCFEGVPGDDAGNWTNRSPYPIVHLLTEDSVTRAVETHPDPESIPACNIARLNSISTSEFERLFPDK
ncbi:MAG: DUF1415 domain-containing protein [Granulosicoccus sp.]